MPGVSVHLDQKTLDVVKAKSKTSHIPVSQIIRKAIEEYLSFDEKKAAKQRVLNALIKTKPLGGMKKWEEQHKERTSADADRR